MLRKAATAVGQVASEEENLNDGLGPDAMNAIAGAGSGRPQGQTDAARREPGDTPSDAENGEQGAVGTSRTKEFRRGTKEQWAAEAGAGRG